MQSPPNLKRCDIESGFVLLAVIFLSVVLLISLAIAAPQIARSIQRQKELETIHRGEQYRRAIQLYYRKFQSYPTSIDQLVETNQIRFLRKRYKNPLTGKDDWKPVLFGQAHVRPLGFFGQPLAGVGGLGAAAAATGAMGGSMYAMAATTTDANGVPVAAPDGSSAAAGAASASQASAFGSPMGSSSGSATGSSFGSTMGSSSFGSASPMGSSMGTATGSPMGASPSGSMFGASGTGTSATTFGGGGGPIVGYTLPLKKPSLITYMKQTNYNQWEFNYDPIVDQLLSASSIMGGGASMNNSGGALPGSASPMGTTPGTPSTPGSSSPTASPTSPSGIGSTSSPTSPSSPFPQ